MLLKSGMSINLATGQVFLTQNVNGGSTSDEAGSENATTEVTTVDSQAENTTEDTTVSSEGEAAADGETVSTEGETGTEGDGTTEGEATSEEGTAEGEMGTEGEVITDDLSTITTDGVEGGMDIGMYGDMYTGMDAGNGTEVKDPLLSNWFFVIGISAATLVVSVVLGILLAKKRIKKGIELYED